MRAYYHGGESKKESSNCGGKKMVKEKWKNRLTDFQAAFFESSIQKSALSIKQAAFSVWKSEPSMAKSALSINPK